MEWIADLHLHSKYSRAVSPQMELPMIAKWAAIKGISLVGTGDWTHPLWLNELKSQLEEEEEGIYKLKFPISNSQFPNPISNSQFQKERGHEIRFLLATEISSIYTQGGKQRRIHNLVSAPSFGVVEKINQALLARGCNLSSDGRPIIGLSARDLAELVFSVSEDCLIIPAHIWTPWFSLFGANSGFDSLEECFGGFSDKIYAVETGLSSDPAMNWRIKELDNRTIVSFSDAHSPRNLGREATVFAPSENGISNVSYKDIRAAIKGDKGRLKIAYTIEFFPEEGKYHYTGHRNCGVCQSPEETAKLGPICPACGRKLTVGVMHRVQQLAGRELKTQNSSLDKLGMTLSEVEGSKLKTGAQLIYDEEKRRVPYVMLVPLREIIAESLGIGKGTKGVEEGYFKLATAFDSEFEVLLRTPIGEIEKVIGKRIAEGIRRVRDRDLCIKAGFDGVFGEVRIWSSFAKASEDKEKQLALF